MSKQQYKEWDRHTHLINPACPRPETLAEALENGYTYAGETWQRGYISRRWKPEPEDIPIRVGGGKRHGWLYFLKSSRCSNQYIIRQYLRYNG